MTTPHPFAALIRKLDAEASKAPWWWVETDRSDSLNYRHGIDRLIESDDDDVAGMLSEPAMEEPNARAIVTLRNAAPEVAALVEAAGALLDGGTFFIYGADDPVEWVSSRPVGALRAALDALAAKAKETA